jgi:hypothetical protein
VFPLAPEDAALLRRGDGAHELQILCVRLDDTVMRLHWPCHASLTVNGAPVVVPCRTAACDLGRTGRDPPGIVPPAVYAAPAATPHAPVTLRLVLAGYDTRPFAVLARVAARRSMPSVAAEVPPLGTFAADLARARGVAGGDEDVQLLSVSISLRCPLGGARVATPVRYAACRGLAVFDLDTFLAVSARSRHWACPLCAACGPPSALRRDAFVAALLRALASAVPRGAFDDVADVEVNRHGAWRPRSPNGTFGRWYTPEETERAATPGGEPLDASGGGAEAAAGGAGGEGGAGGGGGGGGGAEEDIDVIVISDSEEEEAPPPKRQHTQAPAAPAALPLPALVAPVARVQGTSPPPAPETQPQEEAPQLHAPPLPHASHAQAPAQQQAPQPSLLRVRLAMPPEVRLMPRLLPSSLQAQAQAAQQQPAARAPPPPSSSLPLPFGFLPMPPQPRPLLSMPSLDPLAQQHHPRATSAPGGAAAGAGAAGSLDDAAARLAHDMFGLGGAGASLADAFLREDATEGGWRPRHAHAPPRPPAAPSAPAHIDVVEIDD